MLSAKALRSKASSVKALFVVNIRRVMPPRREVYGAAEAALSPEQWGNVLDGTLVAAHALAHHFATGLSALGSPNSATRIAPKNIDTTAKTPMQIKSVSGLASGWTWIS